MEENGLANRKVYAEVPPKVEYSLAELGFSLTSILEAMRHREDRFKTSRAGKRSRQK